VKAVDAVIFNPVGVLVDEHGEPYEDAAPALAELDALGVKIIAVTSLSQAELTRAVTEAALPADRVICLTDTEEGLRAARAAGVHPVLMMNDPDEAMRLTSFNPAGGIVSLHELPDLVRFIVTRSSAAR
jgi:beta-phosphoglucomutase-like phosphatase (HAD superfamily)